MTEISHFDNIWRYNLIGFFDYKERRVSNNSDLVLDFLRSRRPETSSKAEKDQSSWKKLISEETF